MARINYLERPKQNDPFHTVMGAVQHFSKSATSPTGTVKVPVKTAKGGHRMSHSEVDERDDRTKRVMFHPTIDTSNSGESLDFNPAKVYNSTVHREGNDDEQRDSILSNASSTVAQKQNSNLTPDEVYTGMSRRCRKILLSDDDSKGDDDSRIKHIMNKHRKKNGKKKVSRNSSASASFLDELKATIPGDNENQEPSKFANRWQKKSQSEEIAKVLKYEQVSFTLDSDDTKPKNLSSPKKFSLSNINHARSRPAPKSDDFFSEMKRWHNEHALRQVEKPREISVTSAVKTQDVSALYASAGKGNLKPSVTKHVSKSDSKKAKAIKKKVDSKKKKEEPPSVEVENGDDDISTRIEATENVIKSDSKKVKAIEKKAASKKEKAKTTKKQTKKGDRKGKKFWRIPMLSRRKPKSADSAIISTLGGDSDGLAKLVSPNTPTADSAIVISQGGNSNESAELASPKNPTLGITQNPTKVPMKGAGEPFDETLEKFLKLQLEMREGQNSAEAGVVAEKSSEESKKDKTQSAAAAVLVETVVSTEEDSGIQAADDEKPDEISTTNTAEKIPTEAVEVVGKTMRQQMFSELKQTESWMDKASALFNPKEKSSTLATKVVEKSQSAEVESTGHDQSTEPIEASKVEGGKEEIPVEAKPSQTVSDKDKKVDPPVAVVEVDKYSVVAGMYDCTEAMVDCINPTITKEITEIILKEESDQKGEIDPIEASREEDVINQQHPDAESKSKSNDNEVGAIPPEPVSEWWFSGFFKTTAQTETPTENAKNKEETEKDSDPNPTSSETAVLLKTPKASHKDFVSEEEGSKTPSNPEVVESTNTSSQCDSVDASLLINQKGTRSGTFDDNSLLTSEQPRGCEANLLQNCLLQHDDGLTVDLSLEREENLVLSADKSCSIKSERLGNDKEEIEGQSGSKEETNNTGSLKVGSFDDSLLTMEEGTIVTNIQRDDSTLENLERTLVKMEKKLKGLGGSFSVATEGSPANTEKKLKDTEGEPVGPKESQTCVVPPASESHSCADSILKDASHSNSILRDTPTPLIPIAITTSKEHSTPVDAIFLRKKDKSKKPIETIEVRTFEKEDSENCNLEGNKKKRTIAPVVARQQQVKAKSKKAAPAKTLKKKNKSHNKKTELGGTLFGRLEPISDKKKQKQKKKKAKRAPTLF